MNKEQQDWLKSLKINLKYYKTELKYLEKLNLNRIREFKWNISLTCGKNHNITEHLNFPILLKDYENAIDMIKSSYKAIIQDIEEEIKQLKNERK